MKPNNQLTVTNPWDTNRKRKRQGETLGTNMKTRRAKLMFRKEQKKAYRNLLKTVSHWTDDADDDDENENDQQSTNDNRGFIDVIQRVKQIPQVHETIILPKDSRTLVQKNESLLPSSEKPSSFVFKNLYSTDLVSTPKIAETTEESKSVETITLDEFKLPTLPESYEKFKLEKADKKKLYNKEWINDMRRAINDGHLEIERIRREKEEYLKTIGKKRESYIRTLRRETSKSLCQEADFSYSPFFYRYFADERAVLEEEAEEEEEESEESEEEEAEEEEDEDNRLPTLSQEARRVIDECFTKRKEELIVEENGVEVRVKDLETLKGSTWLNDEIVNFYFQLIQKRSTNNRDKGCSKVYCFNTFFYKRLTEGGHKALRRWTKKVDLFEFDLILIPVHLEVHWTLAAISIKEKTIKYYDSMNGNNRECLRLLLKYLEDEMKDKKSQVLETNDWSSLIVKGIPQQENGSDCGVFTCKYAERLSLNKPFDFSQRTIPYIREKMIYEITQREIKMESTIDSKSIKSL